MLDNEKRDYLGEHSGANSLTWIETKRAYKDGKLGFYVDRGLALKAASSGPSSHDLRVRHQKVGP
jgi:hypothetical protein